MYYVDLNQDVILWEATNSQQLSISRCASISRPCPVISHGDSFQRKLCMSEAYELFCFVWEDSRFPLRSFFSDLDSFLTLSVEVYPKAL